MKPNKKTGLGRRLKGFMLKHTPGMITCKQFDEFISDYLEGELTTDTRSRFERHLRMCRECRQYLNAYQQTIAVGRAVLGAADEPVPDEVPENLIETILKLREADKTSK